MSKKVLLAMLRTGWQECAALQQAIEETAEGLKVGTVSEAEALRFAHDAGIFEAFVEQVKFEATLEAFQKKPSRGSAQRGTNGAGPA